MLFLFCILTSPLDGLVPKRFSSYTTECRTNVGTWAIGTDHVLNAGVSAL